MRCLNHERILFYAEDRAMGAIESICCCTSYFLQDLAFNQHPGQRAANLVEHLMSLGLAFRFDQKTCILNRTADLVPKNADQVEFFVRKAVGAAKVKVQNANFLLLSFLGQPRFQRQTDKGFETFILDEFLTPYEFQQPVLVYIQLLNFGIVYRSQCTLLYVVHHQFVNIPDDGRQPTLSAVFLQENAAGGCS